MRNNIIAIDGPAGAGKSTIAKLIAEKLGFIYIDTGAMYRVVTYAFLQTGEAFTEKLVGELANKIAITFRAEAGCNHVYLDGQEVTESIREHDVTCNVSKVAAVAEVREAMVDSQRKIGAANKVVLDGRDIGTVVFPQADTKIFLTAGVHERAIRRYKELQAKGEEVDLAELEAEIALRDKMDSEREISPLKQADDAVLLDTTNLSIDEVVNKILEIREKK